jgi:hypothetical protein
MTGELDNNDGKVDLARVQNFAVASHNSDQSFVIHTFYFRPFYK